MQAALSLQAALPAELHRLLLVFCRISAALLLLPGFGDAGVPARIRTLAALAMALCLAPVAGPASPGGATLETLRMVVAEITAGIVLGLLGRLVVAGIQAAGQVIGQCIGLANIFTTGMGPDPSATLGAAIQAGSIAALFAIGGHHAALRAVAESYEVVALGSLPALPQTAELLALAVARCFALAVQLAMPFLVLALAANLAMAGINRALPSMPVFMIGAPALLLAGLYLLAATAPSLLGEALGALGQGMQLR
ncbi:flagellar biosynthetic protein FliR [Paracraurococcus lichenis]|uniref:Flagellar biosynthetic protein FliR n=1 Tax=Paracraurococcus lichenis TaxID=3064888 RepID=A0ABT9EAB1_9PROT|nr:flagellar biosynthetic protein FliR [Paracraurococcus sp. LOR1-02]MDO9713136.1 flagellar biosynthetic protein FliR [Paracraurococcus sp. LOR1-02]